MINGGGSQVMLGISFDVGILRGTLETMASLKPMENGRHFSLPFRVPVTHPLSVYCTRCSDFWVLALVVVSLYIPLV